MEREASDGDVKGSWGGEDGFLPEFMVCEFSVLWKVRLRFRNMVFGGWRVQTTFIPAWRTIGVRYYENARERVSPLDESVLRLQAG